MKYVGTYSDPKNIVTKDKLDAVESRVSTNEDNIAMAESDINGLQTDVGTLKTNVGNIQTALTSKQDVIVGAASTITEDNLAADRALISNSSGKVAVSAVTSTELGYLDGVTSNVQTQLNGKQPTITVNGIVQGDGVGNLSAVETVNADLLDLNPAAVGLGNVDNVKQYSASNPPPYPVTSVNGMTGNVQLATSNITNDSNYITAEQAPVQSVNGQTGNVISPKIIHAQYDNESILITDASITSPILNGLTFILIVDYDGVLQKPYNVKINGNASGVIGRFISASVGDLYDPIEDDLPTLVGNVPIIITYRSDVELWIMQNDPKTYLGDIFTTHATEGEYVVVGANSILTTQPLPSTGIKIKTSTTQPTGLSKGDFWYEITGTIQ